MRDTGLFLLQDDPDILEACVADVQAVYDRDPACEQYAQCMLVSRVSARTRVPVSSAASHRGCVRHRTAWKASL